MIREEELHPIGKFTKPHGVKGEISLVTDYELDELSVSGESGGTPFIVCNMDGIWVPFFIESYRGKSATVTLVKFENPNSEAGVKILAGKTAYVPLAMIPLHDNQPEGWNVVTGYSLTDERLGAIGKIIDINDSTLNILLKVDYKGNEILIPAALVTSIQHESSRMTVSLPERFLEI